MPTNKLTPCIQKNHLEQGMSPFQHGVGNQLFIFMGCYPDSCKWLLKCKSIVHSTSLQMYIKIVWVNSPATVLLPRFFLHIDFCHYLTWVMLNGSKWCSEMYKNDVPPQAMNNSRDLHSQWIYLKGSPMYCRIRGRCVNGNVVTYPAFCGCAHMHTNVFMTVLLIQLLQIDFSRFRPGLLLQPCSLTNYLPPCWLLVSDMWAADGHPV